MTSVGSRQDVAQLDTIRITSVSAVGYHGVLQSERRQGQEFSADLTLYVDLGGAAENDDLNQTINYAHVAEAVVSVITGPAVNLIETVAERIAAIVMEYEAVQGVDVTLHKPSAPIPVPFGSVDVTIHRSRSNPPRVSRPFVEIGAAAVETLPSWSDVDSEFADPHRDADAAPADAEIFSPAAMEQSKELGSPEVAVEEESADAMPVVVPVVLEVPEVAPEVTEVPAAEVSLEAAPVWEEAADSAESEGGLGQPVVAEPELESEQDLEDATGIESEADLVPDAVAETEHDALSDAEAEIELDAESENAPELDVLPDAEDAPVVDVEPGLEAEFEMVSEPSAEPEPAAEPEAAAEPESGVDAVSVAELAQESVAHEPATQDLVEPEPQSLEDAVEPEQQPLDDSAEPESAPVVDEPYTPHFIDVEEDAPVETEPQLAAQPHHASGASEFWNNEAPEVVRSAPTLSELLGGDPNEPLDLSKPLFTTPVDGADAPLPKPFFEGESAQPVHIPTRSVSPASASSESAPVAQTSADYVHEFEPVTAPDAEPTVDEVYAPALDYTQSPAIPTRTPDGSSTASAQSPVSASSENLELPGPDAVAESGAPDEPAPADPLENANTQIIPVADPQPDSADLVRGGTAIFEPVQRPKPQPVSTAPLLSNESGAVESNVFAMHDQMDETPEQPVKVVLAIGANMGDAQKTLSDAVNGLRETLGLTVTAVGPLARTAAVGGPEQQDYLNSVVIAETTLSPRELLRATQAIEKAHHRTREVHWGPRTLDIDIIIYGTLVAETDDLAIPHPRANERAFVLVPWDQADPDAFLPGLGGGPVSALAATAPDREGVRWLALDWLPN
ncbi:2-amino-4-hydroxy-6-hydroxymethyldihydropteridine diphosphokinase [Timonella senegalensis]|uniref:2-amino-4-hydroxy-6- hydroxymethyldihydropteridine diphosphokinase n=1 Tax=Timonella senegalensis TaxID=1465825 RepID=UPI0028AD076C|nr:2-amino-4-hydroxy-6-hydroxymethyldihydropteridine diphosphokinase [Timonella senegalensis]